ncbi:amidohydrolase, partial [Tritonibacter sp. SIMBA_163]
IPESMVIRGTTRWFLPDVGETIIRRMQELAASIASGFGCTARVDYEKRYPSTINTADNARRIRELAVSPDLGLEVL